MIIVFWKKQYLHKIKYIDISKKVELIVET